MPSVSIIMPVYNAERYLDVSVGSVLAQTSPDWELVCFNDASTDTSAAILEKYAGADSRITVIDSPVNVKQGGGRNRAIQTSRALCCAWATAVWSSHTRTMTPLPM